MHACVHACVCAYVLGEECRSDYVYVSSVGACVCVCVRVALGYKTIRNKLNSGCDLDTDFAQVVDDVKERRERHLDAIKFAKSSLREQERKSKAGSK